MKSWFKNIASNVMQAVTGVAVEDPRAAEVRLKWNAIQHFYNQVQNCQSEQAFEKLEGQLPDIDAHLNQIVDILLKERGKLVDSASSSVASAGSPLTNSDGGVQQKDLPAAYELLLGIRAAKSGTGSHGAGQTGSPAGAANAQGGAAAGGNIEPGQSCDIIVRACQYAKHDQPNGTRRIMLKFLSRVFGEADLPHSHHSLLHYGEEVAKPVLDTLNKCDSALDPRKAKAKGLGGGPYGIVTEDHLAYVEFLAVLASKVEETPSLFAFFLPSTLPSNTKPPTSASSSPQGKTPGGAPAAPPSGAPEASCILVEYLLPYVNHLPETELRPDEQLQLERVALGGLLSLLKVADPLAQKVMAGESTRIVHWILGECRRAVLTLCTIPSNLENQLLLQTSVEMVKFFDAIFTLLPQIAGPLDLAQLMTSLFKDNCLTFLDGHDERHYVSSACVLNTYLKTICSEDLLTVLGRLILCPSSPSTSGGGASSGESPSHHGQPSAAAATSSLFQRAFVHRLNDLSTNVVVVALTLINTVVTRVPSLAMREIFQMRLLTTVECQRYFSGSSPVSPGTPVTADDVTVPPNAAYYSTLEFYSNVRELFPPTIFAENKLCGTDTATQTLEIRRKFLEIESMLTAEDWRHHKSRFSFHVPPNPAPQAPPGTPGAKGREGNPVCANLQDSLQPQYFISRHAVQESPLLLKLCQKLLDCINNSFGVNILITQALVSILLLPHPAILIYALEKTTSNGQGSSEGPLATTLRKLSERVEKAFDADDQATPGRTSLDGDAPTAVAAGTSPSSSFSGPAGGSGGGLSTPSRAITHPMSKLSLYRRCTDRPFFDPGPIDGDDTFSQAMRSGKTFIEGCLVLEGFRREMEIVIPVQEMARGYSQLQSSESDG